ncbi:MAG TPA: hypothetical protein PK566_15575 [Pseudobacteroides sp.]|jgi:hypothetical protein|nr:hypothetical protein [Pseudobacteroides sp.]
MYTDYTKNVKVFTKKGNGLGGGQSLVKYSKYVKEAKGAAEVLKVCGRFIKEEVITGTIKGIKNIPKSLKEIAVDIKSLPKTMKTIVINIKNLPKNCNGPVCQYTFLKFLS